MHARKRAVMRRNIKREKEIDREREKEKESKKFG